MNSLALSALRRLRRTTGAFEWVSDGEGGTIRGIRGGQRGNLKGDLMADLIGPGDLAAEGVDRMHSTWPAKTSLIFTSVAYSGNHSEQGELLCLGSLASRRLP